MTRVAMAAALVLAIGGCVTREVQPDPILEMQVPDKWGGGASADVAHAEQLLIERGCPKINLLVRTGNSKVIDFYRSLGYAQDEAVSLGKRLIPDI